MSQISCDKIFSSSVYGVRVIQGPLERRKELVIAGMAHRIEHVCSNRPIRIIIWFLNIRKCTLCLPYFAGCLWWCLLTAPAVFADSQFGNVTIVPVPGGGIPVSAKVDRAGTIHLLFDSASGPQYAKSTDNGKTFETPIPVVDTQSKPEGLEYHGADLAVGKDGTVHVAMTTNAWKLKLPQSEWALFYSRLEPGSGIHAGSKS